VNEVNILLKDILAMSTILMHPLFKDLRDNLTVLEDLIESQPTILPFRDTKAIVLGEEFDPDVLEAWVRRSTFEHNLHERSVAVVADNDTKSVSSFDDKSVYSDKVIYSRFDKIIDGERVEVTEVLFICYLA